MGRDPRMTRAADRLVTATHKIQDAHAAAVHDQRTKMLALLTEAKHEIHMAEMEAGRA